MTLLMFNSMLIVVPISLGRALFNAIPLLPITHGIKCNGNVVDWICLVVLLHHAFGMRELICSGFISFLRSLCFCNWKLCHLDGFSWSKILH